MPKITKIEEQKNNPNRCSIFVEGNFLIGVSLYVIKKHKIEVGNEIDENKLKKICHEDNLEKGKSYAIDYLINKPKKVILDKLKTKGYDEEVTNEIIAFMSKYGYIDDENYAKKFTKDANNIKKDGINKIKQKLKTKGISDNHIEKALSKVTEKEQFNNAYHKINKKIENYKEKSKNKYELKSKCFKYLLNQGFKTEIIQKVLNEILEE